MDMEVYMSYKTTLIVLLATTLAATANPRTIFDPDDFNILEDFTIGPSISTVGPSLEFSAHYNDYVDVRLFGSYMKLGKDIHTKIIDYNTTLNLHTAGVIIDTFPLDNGFKVSSGLLYNDNKIKFKAVAGKDLTLFGRTYTKEQVGEVRGKVDFMKASPYIGLGWDSKRQAYPKTSKWRFKIDGGVLFQGPPRADLTFSGALATVDSNTSRQLQRDLRKNVEDLVDKPWVEYYPFINLAFGYMPF